MSSGLSTSNPLHLFAFSGIASCCGELSTVPIDVVKTRMQLQGELGKAPKYTSALGAFPTIVREEGFFALYKGVQPALLRQATYGSLRIGLYEPVKTILGTTNPSGLRSDGSPSLLNKVLAGVASGAIGSAICNPTDVVKVRMQAAQGARYRNVADAFATIYKLEGLRGLYRGVSPTVQRAAVVAAVELASYDECKGLLVRYAGLQEKSLATHFAASISAGFLVTIFSSPLDVVKSRVMNQPVDERGRGTRYSSTVDCFRKSVQAEGLRSLWKGFWPNFARLGPHCIVTFMVLEQLRNLVNKAAQPALQ